MKIVIRVEIEVDDFIPDETIDQIAGDMSAQVESLSDGTYDEEWGPFKYHKVTTSFTRED